MRYLLWCFCLLVGMSCTSQPPEQSRPFVKTDTVKPATVVPERVLTPKEQDSLYQAHEDQWDKIAEKVVDTDSYYVYQRRNKDRDRYYLIWGDKKRNIHNKSSDTLLRKRTFFNLNEVFKNKYFFLNYSQGTGGITHLFLPLEKSGKERRYLCPFAYSKDKKYVVHYTGWKWNGPGKRPVGHTTFAVTNIDSNTSKYITVKHCTSNFFDGCVKDAQFIGNQLIIDFYLDKPDAPPVSRRIVDLDF